MVVLFVAGSTIRARLQLDTSNWKCEPNVVRLTMLEVVMVMAKVKLSILKGYG